MFTGAWLSTPNYDSLLIGWDAQTLVYGVTLQAYNNTYCLADANRTNMITTDGWTITDGGYDCDMVYMEVSRSGVGTIGYNNNDDLGSRPAGTVDLTYTVFNDSYASLAVSGVSADSLVNVSGFSSSTTFPLIIPSLSSATVDISFTVDASGPFSFNLDFANNGIHNPFRVYPRGEGIDPPDAPILISPAHGSTVGNQDITYTWNEVSGVTKYTLEILRASDDAEMHSARYNASAKCSAGTCAVTVPATLPFDDYKWHVRSWVDSLVGDWSGFNTFTTTLPQVQLRSPGVDAAVYGGRPTFKWYQVDDALSYIIEFYGATSGSDVLIETWQKNPVCDPYCTYRIPRTMDLGSNYGDYRWRIFAKNSGEEGEWSDLRTFTYTELERTVQVSPIDGFSDPDTTPIFEWTEITGATMYLFQLRDLDDNLIGNYLVSDDSFCTDGANCTWEIRPELATGDYKWHVRAKNGRNFGRWTAYREFTVEK